MPTFDTPQPVETPTADLRTRALALINASWTTQAISAAVQLGLPEGLSEGPKSVMALAQRMSCHAPSLLRLLRALSSVGIVVQAEDGRFALTEMGTLLRPDARGSLAAWAEFCGTYSWTAWGNLSDCVRSGMSVRKRAGRAGGFQHLEEDQETASLFNRAMVSLTRSVATTFVDAVDLTGVQRIVDVGGGFGELLAAVLGAHPLMRGVLFDMAHATQSASVPLGEAGVAERCELVTGSFFDAVPAGADAYLLKSVLHDWDDEHCSLILAQCARAMQPPARLLIIERMMPAHFSVSAPDQAIARSDLNMLIGPGGCERTHEQYRSLLKAAGLRPTNLLVLSGGFSVLNAVLA
jgi:hypothetical protein